ncbi:hypothetical protein PVAND_003025 [Polypedilum vanderplanki]|uniref:Polypeptide N-acetylgalactosaminyltransferase n=1 Tax=Polypedilum vanderplanki TaxID=319348 RepID=A0A9J6BT79_POLVA|nr:hypothetical protein PVAND_003025 [Polypedilum vanderplanki]
MMLLNAFHTLKRVKHELKLKDWNDYEIIKRDSLRVGFGEHGKGEKLIDANDIEKNAALFEEYGMSVLISDKISVNRSIPDFRHQVCKTRKYLKDLPKVSIIIIFNDEAFSVFKRTLHSLYNRTPLELVEEVILVNDNSSKSYLYDDLKNYIDEHFKNLKFNIINLKKRHGLMQARVLGAKAAKSELIFIMESHCEMTYNWLPPLIQPLIEASNHRVVTVPIIDNIEWQYMDYYENDNGNKGSRGIFTWDLEYYKLKRLPVSNVDKELDPFPIPVLTGGIFMIRKNYFFEIGPYDEKLIIWGAENIEMSLKVNLCGGKILEVPCSHIGHMFRAFTKSRTHESGIDFEAFNRKRVVEVWFDNYKEAVYMRNKERYAYIDVGDLSEARQVKERLNCKPFEYFLKDIAPDMIENFPPDQFPFAYGRIELLDENLCLHINVGPNPGEMTKVELYECQKPTVANQNLELSWYRDIRLRDVNICIDVYEISAVTCHLSGGNQLFKYDFRTKQIKNMNNKLCIEGNAEERTLKLTKCDEMLKSQKWIFSDFVNATALQNWYESGRKFKDDNSVFW